MVVVKSEGDGNETKFKVGLVSPGVFCQVFC